MNEVRQLSSMPDQLLTVAVDNSLPHRQRMVELQRGEELSAHVLQTLELPQNPQLIEDYFRLKMVMACMPSLMAAAGGQPQTVEVAQAVLSNFQSPIREGLRDRFEESAKRDGKNLGHITGQLSVLAILGTLWWGIANDPGKEGSYIWPTTREKDAGPKVDRWLKTGYDLALHRWLTRLRRIQVKTGGHEEEMKSLGLSPEQYRPDIAVLMPKMLTKTNRPEYGTSVLLYALLNNDFAVLEPATQEANNLLKRAKARGNRYHEKRRRLSQRKKD